MLTIAAVTAESYVGVCHPFRAIEYQYTSKQRAVKVIFVTWLISFLSSLPINLQYIVIYNIKNPKYFICFISNPMILKWQILEEILFFILPLIVISILYFLMILNLKQSNKTRILSQHNKKLKEKAPRNLCKKLFFYMHVLLLIY